MGIGGIIDKAAVHVGIVAEVAFLSADDLDLGAGGLVGVDLSQPAHLRGPEGLEVAVDGDGLIARLGQLRADVDELIPGLGRLHADFLEDLDIVEPQDLNASHGDAVPQAGVHFDVLHVERELIRPLAVGVGAVLADVIEVVDDLVGAVVAGQVAVNDVRLGQGVLIGLEHCLDPVGVAVLRLQVDDDVDVGMMGFIAGSDGFPRFLIAGRGIDRDGDGAGEVVLGERRGNAQQHHESQYQSQYFFHFVTSLIFLSRFLITFGKRLIGYLILYAACIFLSSILLKLG